jgi:D-alanyl-D-alanine carboxypeptidase
VSAPPNDPFAERIATELQALGIAPGYGEQRQLALQPEASELVTARVLKDGRELKLAPATAHAWQALTTAAAAENITLLLISGFRSVAYQRSILDRKLAEGQTLEQILQVNAAPGFSEHHTGRAVDIGTPGCPPLTEAFEATLAFAWLARRAADFGFRLSFPRGNPHGVIYEPWHWRHHGRAGAL